MFGLHRTLFADFGIGLKQRGVQMLEWPFPVYMNGSYSAQSSVVMMLNIPNLEKILRQTDQATQCRWISQPTLG